MSEYGFIPLLNVLFSIATLLGVLTFIAIKLFPSEAELMSTIGICSIILGMLRTLWVYLDPPARSLEISMSGAGSLFLMVAGITMYLVVEMTRPGKRS